MRGAIRCFELLFRNKMTIILLIKRVTLVPVNGAFGGGDRKTKV